jgi:hypothetical protein
MPLTELVYSVNVAFAKTERADQLHHDNAPAHSTALVQVFFGKASHHPVLWAPPPKKNRFSSLRFLALPKAKIAFEKEEIFKCDGHTVHKLSQRRLTANWLAPRKNIHWYRVKSPLTGCQVTSKPRDRFSRYSKWLDTFRRALVQFPYMGEGGGDSTEECKVRAFSQRFHVVTCCCVNIAFYNRSRVTN